MNSDYDKQLERRIDRELKSLPNLKAPETLHSRIMLEIQRASSLPWYRQPWHLWPKGWQFTFAAAMLLVFSALCFAGREFMQSSAAHSVSRNLGALSSDFSLIWDTLLALAQAIVLVVKKLGWGFVTACLTLAAFSYLACVGLGTAFVRYAFSRR